MKPVAEINVIYMYTKYVTRMYSDYFVKEKGNGEKISYFNIFLSYFLGSSYKNAKPYG